MVCLTYSATLNTIDRTTEGYDDLPITWRDSLLQYVPVTYLNTAMYYYSCAFVFVGTSE